MLQLYSFQPMIITLPLPPLLYKKPTFPTISFGSTRTALRRLRHSQRKQTTCTRRYATTTKSSTRTARLILTCCIAALEGHKPSLPMRTTCYDLLELECTYGRRRRRNETNGTILQEQLELQPSEYETVTHMDYTAFREAAGGYDGLMFNTWSAS
jgi:hypothetical protein